MHIDKEEAICATLGTIGLTGLLFSMGGFFAAHNNVAGAGGAATFAFCIGALVSRNRVDHPGSLCRRPSGAPPAGTTGHPGPLFSRRPR